MAALVVAWACIWAAYGFRYQADNPRHGEGFEFPWDDALIAQPHIRGLYMADGGTQGRLAPMSPGIVQHAVGAAARLRLLPEAWLYGLVYVDTNARYRPAFLDGEWEATGWWWFFPFAFLVKSTPAELLMFPAAGVCWLLLLRGNRTDSRLAYKLSGPLAAGVVFAAFALSASLNIGHRHILPLYALGFLFAGLVPRLLHGRLRPAFAISTLAAALAVQITSAAGQRPHFLAYFNPLAGGPDRGYDLLVDSSLDWGQGLPDLAKWLRENSKGRHVFLSYFGADEPSYHGISATRFGDVFFQPDLNSSVSSPPYLPGLFIFSATQWQRVNTLVRGPWRTGYEKAYGELQHFWLYSPPPELNGKTRETASPAEARQLLIRYENLRFGRLCHFLRNRAPDAIVAHSLLVFDLSDADLRTALFGPVEKLDRPAPTSTSDSM